MSDKIKLSKETVEVLKKLHDVNQNIRLKKGVKQLRSISDDRSLFVNAPITEEFPRDFNIYDLREFLAVLSIIPEPTLDFSNNKYLKISSEDGKQHLRYMESSEEFISSYIDKDPEVKEFDVELKVAAEGFASVMKAASTMGLENVGFVCDGEKVTLSAFDANEGDGGETNNFSVEVGECDTKFRMFYKSSGGQKKIAVLLGEGDLTFNISKKKVCQIKTETGKVFFTSFNPKSSFGS